MSKIDGSLTGETNPIRPLAVPEREIDLIIVYEASSDSPNDWVNGTNLISKCNWFTVFVLLTGVTCLTLI